VLFRSVNVSVDSNVSESSKIVDFVRSFVATNLNEGLKVSVVPTDSDSVYRSGAENRSDGLNGSVSSKTVDCAKIFVAGNLFEALKVPEAGASQLTSISIFGPCVSAFRSSQGLTCYRRVFLLHLCRYLSGFAEVTLLIHRSLSLFRSHPDERIRWMFQFAQLVVINSAKY
jgi:hypothetical protein